MTIKTATYQELTKDELYRILQLRSEVFVVEQDCPYQDLDDMDQHAIHIWAEDDEGVVSGCLRVFRLDDAHSQIGRVITKESVRGTGLGKVLMEYGVAAVREHFPDLPCLIHAQSYATGFYEKSGFKVSSEDFLEDGIPHREMILEI